jgi:hypothetical protein
MKRNPIIFILFLIFLTVIAFSEVVRGLGVGVIPDKLVFDGDEESFRIINPNNADIDFQIISDVIYCTPGKGNISQKSSTEIICIAKEGRVGEEIILVETALKGDDESVGVLPAVALKAEIMGEEAGEQEIGGGGDEKGVPLSINNQETEETTKQEHEKSEAELSERSNNWAAGMKAELVTIALLTLAILVVLVYSEIKQRKEEKENKGKKEKDEKRTDNKIIFPVDGNKDPQQEKDLNTPQDSGHP